jgi:glutathione S-transferase
VKLYTGPLSLFSAKVRIALAEKGLPFESVSVGWSPERRYEPHHPEVVALNPRRQVPVLVDGTLVVTDSTRILEYLDERFPEPPLMPADPVERARCRELEAFGDEVIFPALWDLIEEAFYPAGPSGRDVARAESARARIGEHFAALDAGLVERDFLCGGFGIADIGVFVMVSTALTLGCAPSDSQRQLLGWLARTGGRPAVKQEIEGMQAFVAGLSSRSGAVAAGAGR